MNDPFFRFGQEPDTLAQTSLAHWPVPSDCRAELISYSENMTFRISNDAGYQSILRLHRPDYHDRVAIESELHWMEALNRSGVATPPVIPGHDGQKLQQRQIHRRTLFMVMFAFLEGHEPDPGDDLPTAFGQLGTLAARCHRQATEWPDSAQMTRPHWDENAVFGSAPLWGRWQDAPNLTPEAHKVIARAQNLLSSRLTRFGKSPDRYGLIHADMRLANLLIHDRHVRLIDFDDCGFGWFLYDFAAAISFMENRPEIETLRESWLAGYQEIRPLEPESLHEIDSFVLLRRLALLAWVGSHHQTNLAREHAPDFADGTATLAERYLLSHQ